MNIILASKSVRRIDLLKNIIDDFDIIPSEVEEVLDLDQGIEEAMKNLAFHKAQDVFKDHPDAIVIGSDTLVFLGSVPLQKPKDKEHASKILKLLRGKKHSVYTSVAILSPHENCVFVERTDVTFKDFSDDDLNEFLETDIWIDKAGAYAIQSLDDRYVKSVDGEIETVIGFPTKSVKQKLNEVIETNLK